MADEQEDLFGRLAVEKGYITAAQLDECMSIRSCQKIPAPLELILVERGYIDEVALGDLLVLVEQRRSGKEESPETSSEESSAGDDESPLDSRQDSLFGRIVVQRGLIASAAVNSCVAEQGKLQSQGTRVRLGKLLVSGGHLTMRQVLDVLEYMRGQVLYCEECATLIELAVEAKKSYTCSGCGAVLTAPQEITTIKATDLFSSRTPESAAEKASAAEDEEDSEERRKGDTDPAPGAPPPGSAKYRPVGEVREVPSKPKPAPAPAAPTESGPQKKPMVVVGKGGGVRPVAAAATPAKEERVWHFAVNRKVQGPVSAEQIKTQYREGKLDAETLVWRKGMQEWQPLGKVTELREVAAPTPTPPPVALEDLQDKLKKMGGGDTMLVRKPSLKAPIPPPKLEGYKILEIIGKGGMGIVYKGFQESMDRVVAIKVMVPKYSEDEEFKDRFTREARASARVNHPNIIQGIDVRQVDGKWCFIMEYADGQRVGDVIRRGGAMSESRALKVITEIAAALDHAHRNKIVHRDVKPDNIIVTKEGIAKLCDLGLVKVISEDTENSKVGDLIGTPDYMSPEQASGKPDVDHRADIYCLGGTWYHMVTGGVPFAGPNRSVVLMKHLTEPLQPADERNPLVSAQTSSVIMKMMKKNRDDRYQTTAELLKDLQLLAAGAPPSTFTAPPPEPQGPKRPRGMRMRRRRLR